MPDEPTAGVETVPTVLYIHHRPELGGAPTSLYHLLLALDRRRYRPVVLCPGGEAAALFALAQVPVHVGPISTFTHVETCTYHGLRWAMLARELANALPHVRLVARLVRQERAAVIHLNEGNMLLAMLVARRCGARVVVHFRGMLAEGHWGMRRRLVRALLSRGSHAVIAIDSSVAGPLAGVRKLVIVPNSVDLHAFGRADRGQLREELGIPPEALVAGMVGRVREEEGSLDFLHAAAGVRKQHPDAWFLLVGGGTRPPAFFRTTKGRLLVAAGIIQDDLAQAEALAARLGLGNVRFVPFRRDAPAVYAALDLVVTGGRAGIGRQALEAAAAGRPIVAASERPAPDLVCSGESGIIVPPGDPGALAEAIGHLFRCPEQRRAMGAAGRALAEERFHPTSNADRVMAIYDQLLSRTPASRHP